VRSTVVESGGRPPRALPETACSDETVIGPPFQTFAENLS
jgi:hypothetical protein